MNAGEMPWVPKVHPASRHVEAEDPLELVATPMAGDPSVMLDCILQEFVWMGWSAEQLLGLFDHPGYPLLGELRDHFGADVVEQQVRALLARSGQLRFRVFIAEPEAEEDEHVPELVQIRPLAPSPVKLDVDMSAAFPHGSDSQPGGSSTRLLPKE